ncbi:MAG: LysE family transporter [Nitrososphaeria archaeon]|jgi:threonine/homoserine/homoserine lactone efflux protein
MGILDFLAFYASMVALGLSMAAPPGPVNAMIAAVSVESKLRGIAVGAGAMTADIIFFMAVSLIRALINSEFVLPFYVIGGTYTVFLGFLVLRSRKIRKIRVQGGYLVGLTMGITNPYQIAWWISFGIAMLDKFGLQSGMGFFSGILIWIITYPYIFEKVGKKSVKFDKLIRIASAAVLFILGTFMITLFIVNL